MLINQQCCCEEPCQPPTVVCTIRSATERVYDYQISSNADSAWIVRTCFDASGNSTDTVIPITVGNGSITPDEGCVYRVFASNECGEVSDGCSDPVSGCFPCGTTRGALLYGVIIISDIPDNLPANCVEGRGYGSAEWQNFGDWNGTVIWDAAMVANGGVNIQMGVGRMRYRSDTPWIDVAYGVFAQCAAGGQFAATGRPAFTIGSSVLGVGGSLGGGSGATWSVVTQTTAGRCNHRDATPTSNVRGTYQNCPPTFFVNGPEALPLAFANITVWDVPVNP